MPADDGPASGAAEAARRLLPAAPTGGIILGSGLAGVAGILGAERSIPYSMLPGFPRTGVDGHEGTLFAVERPSGWILLFSGRFHRYEGVPGAAIGISVDTLARLGARRVLLTCAAGAIDPTFSAGDLMVVSDHLNLSGWNPVGEIPFARREPRFLDLSRCYDPGLGDGLAAAARERGVRYHRGVLACVAGPTFETPAEVRMLEKLGADAVCMSTVPEAILARYRGLDVGAVAFISNRAAGFEDREILHDRVLDVIAGAVSEHADFFAAAADLAAGGAPVPGGGAA